MFPLVIFVLFSSSSQDLRDKCDYNVHMNRYKYLHVVLSALAAGNVI